jgi:MYXO-CTERM domain-containing protein
MKTRLLLGSAVLALSCAAEPEYVISEVQPIVNGELAAAGDFNAVGLLFFGNSLCTGTLLDTSDIPGAGPEDVGTWVITASHCTIESQASQTSFNIGNGSPSGFVLGAPFFSQSVPAKKLFTHPKFISQGGLPQFFLGNDVALVELQEPVVGVTPIPFNQVKLEDITTPSTNANQLTDCDITKNCFTVVGFGDTLGGAGDAGGKRFVNIILEGLDSEHIKFGNFNHGGDGPDGNGSGNTCQGDSGGPSFMNINGKLRVIAVTSGGDTGCIGDSFSQRTDTELAEFLVPTITGGIPPGGSDCGADGECQDGCGISDPDCGCVLDGFCQAANQCPEGILKDPDCPDPNNNTPDEPKNCAVSASPTSSSAPVAILGGLFAIVAVFGLRRRKS